MNKLKQSYTFSSNKHISLIYNFHKNPSSKGICILLHGLGDSSQTFSGILNDIKSSNLDILYYDHPGHGQNKSLEIEFEQNLEVLNDLINKHASEAYPCYFIAHSMGGLILLLTLKRYQSKNTQFKIFTIEPSISYGDKLFFKSILEPPIGIGYDGFIEVIKNDVSRYAPTYFKTLQNSSKSTIKKYIKHIHHEFDNYQNEILNSKIKFIYAYGQNSSYIAEREKMGGYNQINIVGFNDAQHWVHIDAESEISKFINTRFFMN